MNCTLLVLVKLNNVRLKPEVEIKQEVNKHQTGSRYNNRGRDLLTERRRKTTMERKFHLSDSFSVGSFLFLFLFMGLISMQRPERTHWTLAPSDQIVDAPERTSPSRSCSRGSICTLEQASVKSYCTMHANCYQFHTRQYI